MSVFHTVIGQERIQNQLMTLWQGKSLPHTLLFYGAEGTGKRAMARALAGLILGHSVFTSEMEEGKDIYIDGGDAFIVRPMGKTGLKIGQWHQLLHEYLSKTSVTPRIVIIEDFQTAREDFSNALLKSIEEPPANVYFILITTKKEKVLPTIISRSMRVPFSLLSVDRLTMLLEEKGYGYRAQEAAIMSQGAYYKAEQYLEDEAQLFWKEALHLLGLLTQPKGAYTQASLYLQDREKEDIVQILSWMRVIARDLMALHFTGDIEVLQLKVAAGRLFDILPKCPVSFLYAIFENTIVAERALGLHIRLSLVIDGLLLSLIMALKEERS